MVYSGDKMGGAQIDWWPHLTPTEYGATLLAVTLWIAVYWGQRLWHRQPPPIDVRRAERELFFWTVRQALMMILLAALTIYIVVALAKGRLDDALRSQGLKGLLSANSRAFPVIGTG